MPFWLVYSLALLKELPLNGSWNFLSAQLKHGPISRSCFWLVSLKTIRKFQCQLSLQPSRRKESLSKLSSRDFRAWHSVIRAAWPGLHWLKRAVIICKLSYSLKWEWRNVTLGSSWCYKANKRKRLSPGSGLKKKTANRDPTSQCDALQSHLLNREEGILWQRRSNHLQRPSQSVRGGMASGQPRANKLYSFKDEHVVSLFKLLQKSNKLKLSEIRRSEEVGKADDPNYCLYHRMLGVPYQELLHL